MFFFSSLTLISLVAVVKEIGRRAMYTHTRGSEQWYESGGGHPGQEKGENCTIDDADSTLDTASYHLAPPLSIAQRRRLVCTFKLKTNVEDQVGTTMKEKKGSQPRPTGHTGGGEGLLAFCRSAGVAPAIKSI
ncbi:hypothetical protein OUZ56_008539 [Daphnia magna]|uniref:Secreted protein n=1 Tax=Daphnia magna TaxID=35525 RepID=A0ABR0ADB5_9CRUS|nr:hypothetical protein OUZ56_008539 [Daphnia magna]